MWWTLWRFRDFSLITWIPSQDISCENIRQVSLIARFTFSKKESQSFRQFHPLCSQSLCRQRLNLSCLFYFIKKRHRNVFFKWFSETLLILNKYYSMAVYHKHIMIFILKPKKDKLRILFIWSSCFLANGELVTFEGTIFSEEICYWWQLTERKRWNYLLNWRRNFFCFEILETKKNIVEIKFLPWEHNI